MSGLGEAMGGTAGAVLMESLRGAGVLELVLRMAASGHLVLAASDGADTAEAVAGKGPDAGGVASALVLVMAQRLMRRVCESCGREVKADAKRLAACGLAPGELPGGRRLREGAGCDACGKTGYKGRVAVYEAMKVTPSLRRLIARGASAGEVRAAAVQEGMRTLRESAVKMVRTGVSTIEEFGKLGLGAAATRAKKKRRARS